MGGVYDDEYDEGPAVSWCENMVDNGRVMRLNESRICKNDYCDIEPGVFLYGMLKNCSIAVRRRSAAVTLPVNPRGPR